MVGPQPTTMYWRLKRIVDMTEDDTFRVLARISFEEMFKKMDVFHWSTEYLESAEPSEKSAQFLRSYGWGYEEYIDKLRQNNYI